MEEFLKSFVGTVAQSPTNVNRLVTTAANLQTEAQAAAAELKLAIKAQLIMQALSTLGVLYLCYIAWEEQNRKGER